MDASLEQATMRKVAWRLVPFLCILYIIAFIDRINVGFASLTMGEDLGLTSAVLGSGAGLFFISYFLFEVPSNLMLHKFGARRWIARVMISWASCRWPSPSSRAPESLYLLRLPAGRGRGRPVPGGDPLHHLLVPQAAGAGA